jgi:hypothetical protein
MSALTDPQDCEVAESRITPHHGPRGLGDIQKMTTIAIGADDPGFRLRRPHGAK